MDSATTENTFNYTLFNIYLPINTYFSRKKGAKVGLIFE